MPCIAASPACRRAAVGNPEPLVAVLGLTVTRSREATGGHTQLTLKRRLDVLDGIAFGRPDLAATVAEGDSVDVVAAVASRTFGGFESLQLEIRDVATSGAHPEAAAILAAAGLPGRPPRPPRSRERRRDAPRAAPRATRTASAPRGRTSGRR